MYTKSNELKCRPQRNQSDANARIFNYFLFGSYLVQCAIVAGIQRYLRVSCHHKQSWRPCAPYGKTCSRKVYRCDCTRARTVVYPHITHSSSATCKRFLAPCTYLLESLDHSQPLDCMLQDTLPCSLLIIPTRLLGQ